MLTGTVVYQTPIGDAFIERFGYRYALMHRGDLLQILVSACKASNRISLKTSSRVTDFRDLGDRVVVSTADGETYEGQAMIAADGLWSMTRSALFGAEPPQTDSYIVCRGVVPVSEIPGALYSQSVTMWDAARFTILGPATAILMPSPMLAIPRGIETSCSLAFAMPVRM